MNFAKRYFVCTDRGLGVNFINSLIYKLEGENCYYSNEHNEYFSEEVIYDYTKDWEKDYRNLDDHYLYYTHFLKNMNFDKFFDKGLVVYSNDDKIGNILYNVKKTLYSVDYMRHETIHQYRYDTTIEDFEKFKKIDDIVCKLSKGFYKENSFMSCLVYQRNTSLEEDSVLKQIKDIILGENLRGKGNDNPIGYYKEYEKYFDYFYIVEYQDLFFKLKVPSFLKKYKKEISEYSQKNIFLLEKVNEFLESEHLCNYISSSKKYLNHSINNL